MTSSQAPKPGPSIDASPSSCPVQLPPPAGAWPRKATAVQLFCAEILDAERRAEKMRRRGEGVFMVLICLLYVRGTSLGYEENKHEPKSHKRGRIRFVSGELATMLEHIYSHQTTTVSSLLLKR